MKPRNRWRERAQTVGFMFAITLVCGAAVATLQVGTAERVRQNAELFKRRAVRAAAGLAALPDAAALQAWFDADVRVASGAGSELYHVRSNGADVAHVQIRSGSGLWGTIRAAVGLTPDGGALTGLSFLSHNETPGLGARIDEPWFTAQMRGRRGPLRLKPEDTRSEDPQEIDAITGATITSTAVRDLLNKTLNLGSNLVSQTAEAGGGAHGSR